MREFEECYCDDCHHYFMETGGGGACPCCGSSNWREGVKRPSLTDELKEMKSHPNTSSWESNFLSSIIEWVNSGKVLSPKQESIVQKIRDKTRSEAPRPVVPPVVVVDECPDLMPAAEFNEEMNRQTTISENLLNEFKNGLTCREREVLSIVRSLFKRMEREQMKHVLSVDVLVMAKDKGITAEEFDWAVKRLLHSSSIFEHEGRFGVLF